MGLTIGKNIDSLIAQGNVRRTVGELSDSYERLSSGLRINTAQDDPAGLSLSAKLEADARIAGAAIRNANDGISLTTITDSALSTVDELLTRMLELATQSANGVNTNTQRSSLSLEFSALGSEVDRIARTASFNNLSLLSNSSNIALQVGFDSSANSVVTLTGVRSTLDSLGLAATGSSALTYSLNTTSTAGSEYASTQALSAVQNALSTLTSIRGTVGAAQSRLYHAVNYLEVARENFTAAGSRIRDVDVAEEVANMVSLQIRRDAGLAVVAQANQGSKLVLDLLK